MPARAEFEHAHAERRRQIVADLLVMRPMEVAAKYRISRQRVHQIKQKEAARAAKKGEK